MLMNYERQLLPQQALDIAKATISALNLSSECYAYGNTIKTYHCQLTDKQRNLIFYGCGKGLGLQSSVSAHFEALEHYALHMYCQMTSLDPDNYFHLSYPLIFNKLEPLDIIPKKCLMNNEALPCAVFSEITTGETLTYPLYLTDPRYVKNVSHHDSFNYESYAWRASDSGTASGTSEVEASLHALNEIIERDAYSLFLINTFLKKTPIRLINKQSLPKPLKDIVTDIETHYADELLIADMTSDIGVPSFVVSMTKQTHLIQSKGCGTSLNREYALERALLECLQPIHIHNEHLLNNQAQILANFAHMPLLSDCAKGDLSTIPYQDIDFNSLPVYDTKAELTQQVDTLVTKIKSRGFDIYSKQIAKLTTGFTCVKYLIPGMEQFYLVQAGKYILPNKRGMSLLNGTNTTT